LALFGRRPPQRADSHVMPATENQHKCRHWSARGQSVGQRAPRSATCAANLAGAKQRPQPFRGPQAGAASGAGQQRGGRRPARVRLCTILECAESPFRAFPFAGRSRSSWHMRYCCVACPFGSFRDCGGWLGTDPNSQLSVREGSQGGGGVVGVG
jgi:hypothetical protein